MTTIWTCSNGHVVESSDDENPMVCSLCGKTPLGSELISKEQVNNPSDSNLNKSDKKSTTEHETEHKQEVDLNKRKITLNPTMVSSWDQEENPQKAAISPGKIIPTKQHSNGTGQEKNTPDKKSPINPANSLTPKPEKPSNNLPNSDLEASWAKPLHFVDDTSEVKSGNSFELNQTMSSSDYLATMPPISEQLSESDRNEEQAKSGSSSSRSFSSILVKTESFRMDIPGYEILEELGRGGMGVVYKANQLGLNRTVALKMILASEHAGQEQFARFHSEAQMVAKLQHPNIVQIYEVSHQGTYPYFSLEYVDGGSLAQKLNGQGQNPRNTASFIETLARAMAVAHEAGIIHRDLKPANILLANPLKAVPESIRRSISSIALQAQHPFGIPKITDFGLAKQLEQDDGRTQAGTIMGTPAYMSPEQAAGKIGDIGPLSDLYSLGAILYEMLTGRPPFVGANPVDTIMQVMRDDPVSPTHIQPKIPRDLEIICMKCLEKPMAKRYPDCLALADDLHRFLDGEPISARSATRLEKIRKWVRRHPATSGLIGSSIVGIIALFIAAWLYHLKIQDALALAENEKTKLEQEQDKNLDRTIRLMVANGTECVNQGDYLRSLAWFTSALQMEKDPVQSGEMHRIRLHSILRECPSLVNCWFHEDRVSDVLFHPDGQRIITVSDDHFARVFAKEGTESNKALFELEHPASVFRARISKDGKQLGTNSADGKVRIWNLDTGKLLYTLSHDDQIISFNFNPEGNRIITTSKDHLACIWDCQTGDKLTTIKHSSAVTCVDFSSNGHWFATGCEDGSARIWEESTGEPISPVLLHSKKIIAIGFNSRFAELFTASEDGTFQIWSVPECKIIQKAVQIGQPITCARFSPNGKYLVLATKEGLCRVWDCQIHDWLNFAVRHASNVYDLHVSPDGSWAASASEDNSVKIWEIKTGKFVTPPLRHNGSVYCSRFSPAGNALLSASQDGIVRLWELSDLQKRITQRMAVRSSKPKQIYSPDRRLILKVEGNQAFIIDSATNRTILKPLTHHAAILHACFSPDGKMILTTSADRTAKRWEVISGEQFGVELRHGSEIVYGTYSPNGKFIATGSGDNSAKLWDALSGKLLVPPLFHASSVEKIAFSPDSHCLLTLAINGQVRIWETDTGESLTPSQYPTPWIRQVLENMNSTGWDLPPDQRDLKNLEQLAMILSGDRIDRQGALIPLDGIEFRKIWESYANQYLLTSNQLDEHQKQFHLRLANQSEQEKDWFALDFHLSKLLYDSDQVISQHHDPYLAQLHYRRGCARAELNKWEISFQDFIRSLEYGNDQPMVIISAALTGLANQDKLAFQKYCTLLKQEYASTAQGDLAFQLANLFILNEQNSSSFQLLTHRNSDSIINKDHHEEGKELLLEAMSQLQNLLDKSDVQIDKLELGKVIDKVETAQVFLQEIDQIRSWLILAKIYNHSKNIPLWNHTWKKVSIWFDRFTRNNSIQWNYPDQGISWQDRLSLMLLKKQIEKQIPEKLKQPTEVKMIDKIDPIES